MSKLITNNIKLWNVDQFIESFSEPNFNYYYYFIGNPKPFVNDNIPPTLYDNTQTLFVDSYDNMIYGKRITSSDIIQLAPRHDWVSGTFYTKYTHDDDNLFDSNFYVLSNEGSSYSVFKCLDNNRGAASTYRPRLSETSAADDFYFTPTDGYQWKYMYSIETTQYNKFATASHIPVYVNANVVSNAVSGSIDNIEIVNRGSGYASYTNGYFQEIRVAGNQLTYAIDPVTASSNASFYINCAIKITNGAGAGQQRYITGYTVSGATRRVIIDSAFDVTPSTSSFYEITPLVQITGDGTGAAARAIVNSVSNTIYNVEVVSRGEGYTYASVVITGNTGVINVSTGSTTANTATGKAIISPKNGHGSNAASEIGAHYVGISTTFNSALSGNKVVDENDFRVAGILKDPLFANVVLTISSGTGTFQDGEVVSQSLGSPVASIVITNPGSGYTSNADVTITGTNSVPAVANASSNSSGRISQINISNTGQGYILPSATITSPSPVTFNGNTSVSNTDDFISISGNVFQNNDFVKYLVATGNTAVSGLANNTNYYIVQANSTGVKLSSTLNGSAINLTAGASQTGHSLTGNTATAVVVVDTIKTSNAYGIVFAANNSVVKLTNAYGFFITGNTSTNLLVGESSGFTAVCDSSTQPTTYFDQTYKVVGSLVSASGFINDELVTQNGTNANGYLYSSNSTVVRLVNKKGTVNQSEAGGFQYYLNGNSSLARFLVSGVVPSDLVRGTGDIIYIENFTPITKSSGQTEDIKLVLEF